MKKLTFLTVAAALAFAAAPAFADPPTGPTLKTNQPPGQNPNSNSNLVGSTSSGYTQNGAHVSDLATSGPGVRSANVHACAAGLIC